MAEAEKGPGNPESPRMILDRGLELGAIISDAQEIEGGGKFVIVPSGFKVESLDKLLDLPRHLDFAFAPRTLESFLEYVACHVHGNSTIFADVVGQSFTAILDFHDSGNAPTKRKHRITYKPIISDEWARWTAIDGQWKHQVAFVEFLEENRIDVTDPDGATLLELAKTLEAKRSVDFKSGVRLDDSTVSIKYVEETTASGGGAAGELRIPTQIMLGIPVYYKDDGYAAQCFFRYRIDNGNLMFKVDMHRRKEIADDAFDAILEKVNAKFGVGDAPLSIYEGAAPA